jgi:beta-lactamase superfamily II metal-dependent hydrolase
MIKVHMLSRRRFIATFLVSSIAATTKQHLLLGQSAAAKSLPRWTPGVLEIHHIATQRGNSAFFILPDGTTMMVDAGAIYGETPYLSETRPSSAHRPGEWLGRYAKRRLDAAGLAGIDTFLATHLHGDHIGYLSAQCPPSRKGTYRLTGVSDVATIVPIARYVDRALPDFSYPAPAEQDFQKNYRAFLTSEAQAGKKIERFRLGANDQFSLRQPGKYPDFEVRNLAANGEVWTGKGTATKKLFPALTQLKAEAFPSENACSCAIRMRYGHFSYYTGGDLTSETNFGLDPWRDIESPTAEVCGPVSAAVANHHGYFNANGERFVRALQPKVFLIESWDSAHPTVNVLNNLFSKVLYPGKRDVFATMVKPENRIANKRTDNLASREGHIVLRVEPGGLNFTVHILANTDENDTVTATFGPYLS